MATYSFKSVGKTQEKTAAESLVSSKLPFGIKTPLQLGSNSEGILSMNYSLEDQFSDNFRNLLLTNWGERLGQYNFGANLRPITTELSSQDDFDSAAIERIRSATEKWMPFIDLQDFSSDIDRSENSSTAVIKISVTYNIPSLQAFNKRIQIVLYAI
jgi:phage baseplate assembly protein W